MARRVRTRTRLVLVVSAVAMLAVACSGTPTVSVDDRFDGDWELVTGEVGGAAIDVPAGHRITLSVDGGEVGGTSACNHYFGEVSTDGDQVSFSQLGGTDMGCEPDVMDAEATYLGALQRVTSADRSGGLVLTGPGVELRFDEVPPVPTAELVSTVWVLSGLIEGTGPHGAVTSPVGDRATLHLDEDGAVTGSTGCRDLAGRYAIDGDEVVLTELSAHGDCPPDVAGQDGHVLEVLGDGFRVAIDGGQMTVTSRGDRALSYVAEG